MSDFTEFNAFSLVPGTRKKYRLDAPLNWEIGVKGSGWTLTIPEGTVFDISVPRLLEWALEPHDRRILPAAAIHDELLKQGHDAAFASSEFRRAAIARGCPRWWSWVLFFATFIWSSIRRGV